MKNIISVLLTTLIIVEALGLSFRFESTYCSGPEQAAHTGWRSPAATGKIHNDWTNPTNAFSADGLYASATWYENQDWYNFGFDIPSESTINGIEIKIEGTGDGIDYVGKVKVGVMLNGILFDETDYIEFPVTDDAVEIVGGPTDLWGYSYWKPEHFRNDAAVPFMVLFRTQDWHTIRVDYMQVKVYYGTSAPDQPVNISPPNGATNVELRPTFRASDFHDPDLGDTHAFSQWQVTQVPGDYSNPVFDIYGDVYDGRLTEITFGTDLEPSTTYGWRVRYRDNSIDQLWSIWSIETTFMTAPSGPPEGCGWPVLVAPVQISSEAGYSVGDTLTANFAIQNQGTAVIHLDKLLLGGRFNGDILPGGGFPDFTFCVVTLQVSQTYQYEGTLDVTEAGNYEFFVAYYIADPTDAEKQLLDSNNWNTCIDLAEGLVDGDRTWSCRMRIYGIPPDFSFQKGLGYGLEDPEVRYLQIMLNSDPYTRVVSSGDGSPGNEICVFDDLTLSAVKSFQEKHDIVPITGYVGPLTRTKLNEILDQKFSQQVETEFGLLNLEQRKATIWSDISVYIDELIDGVRRYPYLENFPEELALAIACVESGDYSDWNNEHASDVWDRGIMGINWDSWVGAGGVDNLSDDCLKCRNRIAKVYCSRYYSNTLQGIEANIKDALYALDQNYGEIARKGGIIPPPGYSIEEVIWISTVQRYHVYRKYTNPIGYIEAIGDELINLGNEYYGQFDGLNKALAASLGNKFLRAYQNSGSFRIYSPGELQVYDWSGNVTGVVNGEIREEIPNSFFDNKTGTVIIFFPTAGIYCEIKGNETATYRLESFHVDNGTETAFNAVDIATLVNATHQYAFNWTALSQGEKGVAVQVDSDGNGSFEYSFTSDNELTRIEYVAGTTGHDLDVVEVASPKSVAGEDYTILVDITIMNYGVYTETFNVTLYANTTLVASQIVVLSNASSTTITYYWNTAGFAKGNYTLSAIAEQVPGETYTADNTFIDGILTLTIRGDVDGDFDIDIFDVVRITSIYGKKIGDPMYYPNADIDGDGVITIFDVVICTSHYGQKWP